MTDNSPALWTVGSDGSPTAAVAARWAAHLAADHNAALQIVCAWQYPYTGITPLAGGAIPAPSEAGGDEIRRQAETLAEELQRGYGISVSVATPVGPAAGVLLDASAEADAEMIVVGSRGRGGFARLLLGSVSHQLVCHADRPVAIIPPQTAIEPMRSVLVGVDGSEHSATALDRALRFAPPGAAVTAVSVWDARLQYDVDLSPDGREHLRAVAEAEVASFLDRFETQHPEHRGFARRFEAGHVAPTLATIAADADLLVVGARGTTGLEGILTGSTTTWLTHHLPCPTMVVP